MAAAAAAALHVNVIDCAALAAQEREREAGSTHLGGDLPLGAEPLTWLGRVRSWRSEAR
jgi:hypothetical protein